MLHWLTPNLDEANDICDEIGIKIEEMESTEDAQQKQHDDAKDKIPNI